MKKPLEFLFENSEFPDTDSKVPGVSDDITEDAAVVEIEGKEADVREKLVEGNKSMKIDLNDLFIKYCF